MFRSLALSEFPESLSDHPFSCKLGTDKTRNLSEHDGVAAAESYV